MRTRFIAAVVWALVGAFWASAQSDSTPEGIIRRIEFQGLQRVSPATLQRHITSRVGEPLDPARIAGDVRGLERLGWFENISVEARGQPVQLASAAPPEGLPLDGPGLVLVFVLEERPFLARVDFRGSRLLRREQIQALLAAQGLPLKVAAPANRTELWRAARAIERELAELGHPQARVKLRLEPVPTLAVRAVFQVSDGPRVGVALVRFRGNAAFREEELRKRMARVAPHAMFAGLRGKTVFTHVRLAEDLEALERFYRDRGYAEARFEAPQVTIVEESRRRWLPWPRRAKRLAYEIVLPVEEGIRYRIGRAAIEGAPPRTLPALERGLRDLPAKATYSEAKILRARDRIAQLSAQSIGTRDAPRPDVEVVPEFDREAGTARVTFRIRDDEPFVVRRIEFRGHHRFSDRYYRRRVLLREGDSFDREKLERGLAQLARSGFVRPVRSEDMEVRPDPATRTVDLTIRFEEVGRQRISFVGGGSSLGNTLGLAYNVFDLFGGEELITTHLEGGPGALNALLGVAKEGLFGTRFSLGLSIFHNVLRPRLPGSAGQERLFRSRYSGFGVNSGMPLTARDSLGVSYELSASSTEIRLPQLIPGVPFDSLRTRSTRRAVGVSYSHESLPQDARQERFDVTASVSGGWLGGDDKLLRSSVEYAQLRADPLTSGRNAWAWRGLVSGVSTYDDGLLPLHQRLFAGEQVLRGFRTGEVAPYAVTTREGADGATIARAESAGTSLVAAMNTEYRVPLDPAGNKAEAAAFLDFGAGWLLPGWLGGARTEIMPGTNGVLRASTGVGFRVELHLLRQPLRVHYAVNPLRLAREMLLPDGSRFRSPERRTALGWALGPLF
jgi:outer membrane protein assembly complex protein YaeT